MIRRTVSQLFGFRSLAALAVLGVLIAGGCKRSSAPVRVANGYLGPLTIAVAPALNFSGSTDFDRASVADIMASELGTVVGVEVIPVSRVLAVLGQDGQDEIESPAHALEVVDRLGADAILIFAVTEYEPYYPPIVGIAAQLYGARRVGATASLDPVRLSRQARTTEADIQSQTFGPLAQSEHIFDAGHQFTEKDVEDFAKARGGGDSAFDWELYVQSQRHYLRYCCFRTVQRIFGGGVDMAIASGPDPAGNAEPRGSR